MADVGTRFLNATDAEALCSLYCTIASHPSGFARAADEISLEHTEQILKCALEGGVGIAAFDRADSRLVGFILATKPGPRAFDHVLSDLTIGVHPDYQSQGIGRRLFFDFFEHVETQRPDILRVELIARESNARAIQFYESIGFRAEGTFEKRIRNQDGTFESDIPMGWLKPGN